MAKEFKDWDKRFSKDQIEASRKRWLSANFSEYDDEWFERALRDMGYDSSITMGQVRHAVYEAPDAADWQLFRVSLKGMTTQQKVAMLRMRWDVQIDCERGDGTIEKHRIWNYVGALKRGGQLVEDEFGALIINK